LLLLEVKPARRRFQRAPKIMVSHGKFVKALISFAQGKRLR
jgi:hypothetical protein